MLKESEALSGGAWELPGGGLDFGEDIRSDFEREVSEETGMKVTKMSEKPVYLWTYRFHNRRGMEWYYSLVLAYRVEFENFNFTPSEECQEIKFFTKEEFSKLKLGGQITPLPGIFNPDDFR